MKLMQRKLRYSAHSSFSLYHLTYYFSKTDHDPEEKQLILDFKKGKEAAIRHFAIKALQFLEHREMDENLIILRALKSNETKVDSALTPLDRIGDSLAAVFDCTYYPGILTKTRVTQPVKSLSSLQRAQELKDVYKIDPAFFNFNDRKLLIIDDVVTTGTTACAIIAAVLKEFPQTKINVFALAWTPTPSQQIYIQKEKSELFMLNEPETPYGTMAAEYKDEDFENGLTNISVFPWSYP